MLKDRKIMQIESFVIAFIILVVGILFSFLYSGENSKVIAAANPNPYPIDEPAESLPLISAVKFLQAGNGEMGGAALDAAGKVWSWGYNLYGELGLGSVTQTYAGGMKRIPFFVDNNINIVQLGVNYENRIALDDQGRVWAWGHNGYGQAGTASTQLDVRTPIRVNGLPDGTNNNKVEAIYCNNGEIMGVNMAIDTNGDLWIWGYNGYGQHGVGTTTELDDYRRTPHKADFSRFGVDINIVKVMAGDKQVVAIDEYGVVYAWGSNEFGRLGLGMLGTTYAKPNIVYLPNGEQIKDISVAQGRTVALDTSGTIWQWGQDWDMIPANIYVPQVVPIDATEVENIYQPIPQSVYSGRFAAFFLDQYGRPWSWGSGRYFSFGRDGGYETNNDMRLTAAQQWPKVIGDGDTSIYDSDKQTPEQGLTPRQGGNYGFNTLHPTIYDKKYYNEDGTVKESEKDWIGMAGKKIPSVLSISTSNETIILLDKAGNIFKWGLQGSGAVAWGWDYDVNYDYPNNNEYVANGLYNKYTHEVMYMRGAPRLAPATIDIGKSNNKIYKNEDDIRTDKINVKVTLAKGFGSTQMGITINPVLQNIRYIIIPYDTNDNNFKIETPTEEEFNAVYNQLPTGYQQGDLVDTPIEGNQDDVTVITKELAITDNCRIWMMTTDLAYTQIRNNIISCVADNFYTPTTLYQEGIDIEDNLTSAYKDNTYDDGTIIVDGKTDSQIIKVQGLAGSGGTNGETTPITEKRYGLPLDANGNIIGDTNNLPTFGYDKVRITGYEAGEKVKPGYLWVTNPLQENPVDYELDNIKFLKTDESQYIHIFHFRTEKVEVTYKGIIKDSLPEKPVPGFDMPSEEVIKQQEFSKVAQELEDYICVSYKIDEGPIKNLELGKAVFTPLNNTTVTFYYAPRKIHIRQVILAPRLAISKPIQGYMSLQNIKMDETILGANNNILTNTGNIKMDGTSSVKYSDFQLKTPDSLKGYVVGVVIPQYYSYEGFVSTTSQKDHNVSEIDTASEVKLDYTTQSDYWVTIYLKPIEGAPGAYNWSEAINNFGVIK